MKAYFFILAIFIFIFTSCIYDPPIKGKEIIIENQTSNFIYVTDSLPLEGHPESYDTFLVNNKLYISSRANYIPKYNKWVYLFPNFLYKKMKKEHDDSIFFYFITQKDINKNYEEIKNKKLCNSVGMSVDKIENNKLNYIFYYSDSIIITHKHNLKSINKQ